MARASLRNILPSTYLTEERIEGQIALIQHTLNLEMRETAGATYRDCFRGSNIRRTEIVSPRSGVYSSLILQVMMVWMAQYWNGQNIINYSTQ